VKIACIGEATADAVRSFGIQPELIPSGEQTSEGLLAEFSPHDEILDPVGRVLLPRADIATETLRRPHRARQVDDVTVPDRPGRPAGRRDPGRDQVGRLRRGALSVLHRRTWSASPEAARAYRCCHRTKTAETATEFGLRVDVQPPHASVPDLVEALAAYAVELREKLAAMPAKQRRGSKVQGPTALRFR
jgi:uroporphyrinogen III methyltransferase/synthase